MPCLRDTGVCHPWRRISDIKAANDTYVFAGRVVSGADGSHSGNMHEVQDARKKIRRGLFWVFFFLTVPGGAKSQTGHHRVYTRFKNNMAQSVQDPTLPPPTTPGAHTADPVAIETATDFSRAGVLGKGSRDIQWKWDRQDDDGGGVPPSAATPPIPPRPAPHHVHGASLWRPHPSPRSSLAVQVPLFVYSPTTAVFP